MKANNEAIALAYLDAVAKKDLDRVAALVSADVKFVGPVQSYNGPQDLVDAFRRISSIHVRSDIRRVFSDGDEVCVIYDFVTDTAGTLPTIEWLRVRDGRIQSIHLFYDQVPWLKIREELARRAKASA